MRPELNTQARAAVDAYRETFAPSPETSASNWAAIQARLAAGDAPPLPPAEPTPTRRRGRPVLIAWGGAGVAVAAAALAWLAVGDAWVASRSNGRGAAPATRYDVRDSLRAEGHAVPGQGASRSTPARARAGTPDPSAAPEPAVEPLAAPPVAEPAVGEPAAPARPAKPRRSRARPASEHEAPPAADVAAEAAWAGRVRAALRDGAPNRALRVVAEYNRRFPEGALREEVDLLRASALCAAGQPDAARAAAHAFLRAHPRSPLSGHARRVCAGAGPEPPTSDDDATRAEPKDSAGA